MFSGLTAPAITELRIAAALAVLKGMEGVSEEVSGGHRPPWKSRSCQNFFMLRMGSLMAGSVTGAGWELDLLLVETALVVEAVLVVDRWRCSTAEAETDSTSTMVES